MRIKRHVTACTASLEPCHSALSRPPHHYQPRSPLNVGFSLLQLPSLVSSAVVMLLECKPSWSPSKPDRQGTLVARIQVFFGPRAFFYLVASVCDRASSYQYQLSLLFLSQLPYTGSVTTIRVWPFTNGKVRPFVTSSQPLIVAVKTGRELAIILQGPKRGTSAIRMLLSAGGMFPSIVTDRPQSLTHQSFISVLSSSVKCFYSSQPSSPC